MLCGDLNGRTSKEEGMSSYIYIYIYIYIYTHTHMYIYVADMLCFTVETNTTLQTNYTLIEKKIKGHLARTL